MIEPSEEAVRAAAEAIHNAGWTCEAHEPLGLDQCEQCAESTPIVARAALDAAMPIIERDVRLQVAEEMREKVNAPSDVDSHDWRRGFTVGVLRAARLAERSGE